MKTLIAGPAIAILFFGFFPQSARPQSWPPQFSGSEPAMPKRVSGKDLAAALRTPAGAASVQALFDRAILGALKLRFEIPVVRIPGDPWPGPRLSNAVLIPETAGRAWLVNGALMFVQAVEPAQGLMERLAREPEDVANARRQYLKDPAVSDRLDGGLNGHILGRWLKFYAPPQSTPKTEPILGRIVLSVLETGGEEYPADISVAEPPQGRPVGLWHIHPPHLVGDQWFDGAVPGSLDGGPAPSSEDAFLAKMLGRNLTIVFRQDGFDAYDVTASGAEPLLSYRSPAWAPHFEALRRRIAAAP